MSNTNSFYFVLLYFSPFLMRICCFHRVYRRPMSSNSKKDQKQKVHVPGDPNRGRCCVIEEKVPSGFCVITPRTCEYSAAVRVRHNLPLYSRRGPSPWIRKIVVLYHWHSSSLHQHHSAVIVPTSLETSFVYAGHRLLPHGRSDKVWHRRRRRILLVSHLLSTWGQ